MGQANFESALRENLAMTMSDALDNFAINGVRANNATDDAAAQPKGHFRRPDRPDRSDRCRDV